MIPVAVVFPLNTDDQVARPEASEVRIFPSHGDHHVIFTCQLTPSFAHGVDVPIPTSAPVLKILVVAIQFVPL